MRSRWPARLGVKRNEVSSTFLPAPGIIHLGRRQQKASSARVATDSTLQLGGVAAMHDPYVLRQIEGPLGILTLNRSDRRNALSLDLMLELIEALDHTSSDDNVRVIILAASGKAFCSGHDLSEMVGRTVNDYRRLFDVCTQLMLKLQSIPQPVIAQVQGVATAAGCQLVATC